MPRSATSFSSTDLVERYWRLLESDARPSLREFISQNPPASERELVDLLCADQKGRWQRGERMPAEFYLHATWPHPLTTESVVDLIYHEFLLRDAANERVRPEELYARFPEHGAALQRQFELRQALATDSLPELGSAPLSRTDTKSVPELATTPARSHRAFDQQISGYEILGELGRGGMGVVYKARQRGLNRIVALKMILEGSFASSVGLARFQAEAETFARLQHPHIVQIYEVGEHEGRPYFSLEYMAGGSLAQALGGQPQPPIEAARFLEKLAQAVQYAHEHGVVHRDLKPANILLQYFAPDEHRSTKIGNQEQPYLIRVHPCSPAANAVPKITDFGLAKRIDQDSELTSTGAMLGTPSYMAPEQAQGRLQEIGPHTDVYSLGVILYELLTGRPPFRGITALDTLSLVVHDDPLPPHQLQPRTPRDLETICLKCLEKDAHKRYASAQALANDLQRFLAGEPVLARPVRWPARCIKWARRRPAWAGLFGLSGVGALGMAVAVLLLSHAYRARGQAVLDARRQRDYAKNAVHRFFTQISERPELKAQNLEALRRDLLQEAKIYYEQFVQEHGEDPELRAEQGRAYARLASMTATIGDKREAIQLAEKALEIIDELRRKEPADEIHRYDEAMVRIELAQWVWDAGEFKRSEAELRQTLALLDGLIADRPESTQYRLRRVIALNQLARVYDRTEQRDASPSIYDQAMRELDRLREADPQDVEYRRLAADTYLNVAMYHESSSQWQEVEKYLGKAIPIAEALAKESPLVHEYRSKTGTMHKILGGVYRRNGRWDEAEKEFQAHLFDFRDLAAEHPTITRYQLEVGDAYHQLASTYGRRGNRTETEQAYTKSIAIFEKLVNQHPQDVGYRSHLGHAFYNFGFYWDHDRGDAKQAEVYLKRALDTYKQMPAGTNEHSLARTNQSLGNLYSHTNRLEASRKIHQAALGEFERLAAKSPSILEYRIDIAGQCCNLGQLDFQRRDHASAKSNLAHGIATLESILQEYPKLFIAHIYLRNCYWNRAEVWDAEENYQDALADWEKALANDSGDRRLMLELGRAASKAGKGEYVSAIRVGERLKPKAAESSPALRVLARIYARASLAAARDPGLQTEKRDELTRKYAQQAVECLRQAMKVAPFRPDAILDDIAFKELQKSAEFQKLLTEWKSRAEKK